MNNGNFNDQVIDQLSGTIVCSNFTGCTFTNIADDVVFDRCNIKNCTFDKACKFIKCNITNTLENSANSEILNASIFEFSNYITEEDDEEVGKN